MILHACDKCGKRFPKETKQNPTNSPWKSDEQTLVNQEKTHLIKINGQMVEVEMRIKLACGQQLELCHKCGFDIVEIASGIKKNAKKGKKGNK